MSLDIGCHPAMVPWCIKVVVEVVVVRGLGYTWYWRPENQQPDILEETKGHICRSLLNKRIVAIFLHFWAYPYASLP